MPTCNVLDVRGYDPKAVAVAHHLGSTKHSDYVLIADWIKSKGYGNSHVDTLVDLFDREVGLQPDQQPAAAVRPDRP